MIRIIHRGEAVGHLVRLTPAIVLRPADAGAAHRRAGWLAAALCASALLSGCLAVRPLPEHRPLTPAAGLGLVFGQISVKADGVTVPPTNPGADWSAVGLAPLPELRVYLERLTPRRVALPPVSGVGLFAWSLEPGDYLLLALPEEDVGAAPQAQRFRPVAALRVPPGGPWCAGALEVAAAGPVILDRGPLRVDAAVQRTRVVDRCAEIERDIAARYAALASPVAVRLMISIDDLAFEDPSLFAQVRRRLDAAATRRDEP
jgi:hypothetical protein